jgi:hypothetical protein
MLAHRFATQFATADDVGAHLPLLLVFLIGDNLSGRLGDPRDISLSSQGACHLVSTIRGEALNDEPTPLDRGAVNRSEDWRPVRRQFFISGLAPCPPAGRSVASKMCATTATEPSYLTHGAI